MNVQEIECKTALSASTLPGLAYSLNPYRGCQHNCAYCYAPNVLRLPREHWGIDLKVKKNIPLILAQELRTKKHGVVGISTVTDPYQPLEKHYELTRRCLEQLLHHDFPVHIQTKSALVVRDIDLLTQFSDSQVMFSIGTFHDDERRLLEPQTSSIHDRIIALKKCTESGLKTAVFFGPVYQTTTVDEIPHILDAFKETGTLEIWVDKLNLKPGILENIQKTLQEKPELNQRYSKKIQNLQQHYNSIREELQKQAKQRNLKIIDAF